METIRIVLDVAAQLELPVYQLDIKSAFRNGELEEEVYVEQSAGYIVQGKEEKVYRLRKAKLTVTFDQMDNERRQNEPSLYVKKGEKDLLIVCLYVDDLIYTGTNPFMVQKFKKAMMAEFEMTNLGLVKYFLGIQVRQSKGDIFFSQKKYLERVLKKFSDA